MEKEMLEQLENLNKEYEKLKDTNDYDGNYEDDYYDR